MNITNLYVADCHMKWNGISLNPGDLYGHAEWYGFIYSHIVPTYMGFVNFTCVDNGCTVTASLYDLPNVLPYGTTDGGIFFESTLNIPEEYMPCGIATVDGWDEEFITELLEWCKHDEEVAMYVDGDEATFFIHPVYSSPDYNHYGKLIETWTN